MSISWTTRHNPMHSSSSSMIMVDNHRPITLYDRIKSPELIESRHATHSLVTISPPNGTLCRLEA